MLENINLTQIPDFEEITIQELRDSVARLREELMFGFQNSAGVRLIEFYSEPTYLFHGLIVIADGTDWNPGSGRGPYMYDANAGTPAWVFLG